MPRSWRRGYRPARRNAADLHGDDGGGGQRDQENGKPRRINAQAHTHGRQRCPDATDEGAVHREQTCHRENGRTFGVMRVGRSSHRPILAVEPPAP